MEIQIHVLKKFKSAKKGMRSPRIWSCENILCLWICYWKYQKELMLHWLTRIMLRFKTRHNGTHSSQPNGIVCFPGIINLLVAIHIPFHGHSICILQRGSPHQLRVWTR